MTRALLLSGGQDSVAIAYWLRPELGITIDYGQAPAEAEIRAAQHICGLLSIRHVIVKADCASLGSGDLVNTPPLDQAPSPEWWPYRNQLLITLAGATALRHGATELLVGAVASDSSHVDGRQEFFDAMDNVMRMQEGGLRVSAPSIRLSTSQLVLKAKIPLETLLWAHSCHRSNYACGQCRGCIKHKNVMHELGVDPF